jgi:hypothetical protein
LFEPLCDWLGEQHWRAQRHWLAGDGLAPVLAPEPAGAAVGTAETNAPHFAKESGDAQDNGLLLLRKSVQLRPLKDSLIQKPLAGRVTAAMLLLKPTQRGYKGRRDHNRLIQR